MWFYFILPTLFFNVEWVLCSFVLFLVIIRDAKAWKKTGKIQEKTFFSPPGFFLKLFCFFPQRIEKIKKN